MDKHTRKSTIRLYFDREIDKQIFREMTVGYRLINGGIVKQTTTLCYYKKESLASYKKILHNREGPARSITIDGRTESEDWCINDILHRDDGGPALYRRESNRIRKIWCKNGRHYRENGEPVESLTNSDGVLMNEYWALNDSINSIIHRKYHSDDDHVTEHWQSPSGNFNVTAPLSDLEKFRKVNGMDNTLTDEELLLFKLKFL